MFKNLQHWRNIYNFPIILSCWLRVGDASISSISLIDTSRD